MCAETCSLITLGVIQNHAQIYLYLDRLLVLNSASFGLLYLAKSISSHERGLIELSNLFLMITFLVASGLGSFVHFMYVHNVCFGIS